MLCEALVDFAVAGDGLEDTGLRVLVPVVFCAVADEEAALFVEAFDELDAFHWMVSSATWRIAGSSPLVRSW